MKIGVVGHAWPPSARGHSPAHVVERILHLGDVGDARILKTLGKIAPVTAVRGNIDREGACGRLPETEVLLIEGGYLYLLHDLATLHLDPAAAKLRLSSTATPTRRPSRTRRAYCISIPAHAARGASTSR